MTCCEKIEVHSYLYYDFNFTLLSYFYIMIYFNIHAYMICVMYDLSTLRVALKIQVISFLFQVDELFIVDS